MSQKRFRKEILSLRQQLFGISLQMLANREDAEDVVQEVLLKLWRMRGSFNTLDNPAAFATTMTKNLCLDKLKLKKQVESIDNQYGMVSGDNPHKQFERKSTEELLHHIISTLPQLQQLIITMKDIEEYEVEEIAEITGTKPEAVRVNLSRARKKVRETYIKLTKE